MKNQTDTTWTQLETGVAADRSVLDDVIHNFAQRVPVHLPEDKDTIAAQGNPAIAWIEKLDLIGGDETQPELWGLVRWLTPAIKEKVESGHLILQAVIARGARSPSTGLPIGARLLSAHIFPATVDDMSELTPKDNTMKQNTTVEETEVQTVLSKLPVYLKRYATTHLAIEGAVRDLIPRARTLSHHQLWSGFVGPIADSQRATTLSRAIASGAPVRASVVRTGSVVQGSGSPSGAPHRARLDVSLSLGRNRFERLLNLVKTQHPHMTHDAAAEHAGNLNRTHEVVG